MGQAEEVSALSAFSNPGWQWQIYLGMDGTIMLDGG
jgi:hypothetical protein